MPTLTPWKPGGPGDVPPPPKPYKPGVVEDIYIPPPKPIAPKKPEIPSEPPKETWFTGPEFEEIFGVKLPMGWDASYVWDETDTAPTITVYAPGGVRLGLEDIGISPTGEWVYGEREPTMPGVDRFALPEGTLPVEERLEYYRYQTWLRLEDILSEVFVTDTGVVAALTLANEDPEAFLDALAKIGREKATEDLLRKMGLSKQEIDRVFGETPEQLATQAVLAPEPEWENVMTGEVITSSEKAKRYPLGYEAELDEWRLTAETGRNYIHVFRVFGEALLKLPKQLGASILQALQPTGASVVNPDWADEIIADAGKDLDQFVRDVTERYGETRLPIKLSDIATLPQSMAFSLTAMGAGLGVGIPVALAPVPGARIAAWTAGTLASGAVAYNMSHYQIMQSYLEVKDEEMRATVGRGITLEEENQLKKDFSELAIQYGLWEAIPEALSNLAFAKLLTMPLGKMVGRNIASKILTKVVGIYGEEFLTETITQKGQSDIEVQAGLREGRISWVEAFKEIAPQTFLLTTILGGTGQIGVSSVNRIKKALKKEAGDNPVYEDIKENITEDIFAEVEAEAVAGQSLIAKAIEQAKAFIKEERGAIGRPAEVLKKLATPELTQQYITLKEQGKKIGLDVEAIRAIKEGEYWVSITTTSLTGTESFHDWIRGLPGKDFDSKQNVRKLLEGKFERKTGEDVDIGFVKKRFLPFKSLEDAQQFIDTGDISFIASGLELKGSPWTAEQLAQAQAGLAQMRPFKLGEVAPAKPPVVEEVKVTEAVGNLSEGAWVQFKSDGIMYQITKLGKTRATLVDGEGNKSTISLSQAVYPLEAVKPTAVAEEITAKPPVVLKVKPLPTLKITPKEIETNLAITGEPTLTPAQVEKTLSLFGKYLAAPSTESAWELTRELQRETLAGRAENLKIRTQQLIVEKGMSAEDAIKQAMSETMPGVLPIADTDYLSDLTKDMREALFSKVYHVLKDEPFEMMSTTEALTNALLGRAIPREPGIRGGSAHSRLMRVFGDQPQVMKGLETIALEHKPLEDVIDGVFRDVVEGGRPPIPVDQATADYLRGLSTDVIYTPTSFRDPVPVTRHAAPIEDAIKQMPMFPRPALDNIISVLKEIGWSPIDIGNFLRANKASFDFSFWRQQGPMIINHPVAFVQANIESWKATWSQKAAEANTEWVTRLPSYPIYDQIGIDFLRPLELKKGTSQWMGVEEFGYLTGERTIPRLTMKIPWVKFSSRGFVVGCNTHNMLIFEHHYQSMLRLQEKYASGELKLKVGESFSIEKEMTDMAKLLADFTQRAQLGKLKGLAPALSAMFFAPRATLGRFLTPRHLVSSNPRVRMEAFRNLATFVCGIGGIVLLGEMLDLWDVEKDPHNAEYMSIRIGNIRIDPWAGYRQFLVFYVRIITGTGVSSVTGAEYESDPIRAMTNFVRGKAAPLASIVLDFWTGKNFIGEEVDVKNTRQWVERSSPFSIWDIYESYVLEPAKAAWVILPAILGAGVQAYTGEWIENFAKLGIPKYTENLPYGVSEPVYDIKDFYADTAARFKGVDPATLTESKGFPPYIRGIAEARIIKENLSNLPNESLVSLNIDPAKGATFADYYKMWRDREKIVLSGDEEALKAFDADERTRNAQLGNFSQRQFALLNQYYAITDKDEQAEFLKKHKDEIGVNLRKEWLKSHPKENGLLAAFGQAEAYTRAAYDEARRLIKEFDIPDNAVDEYLPPADIANAHFEYLELREEWSWSQWESQLFLAKDDALREWLGYDPIQTPVRELELKIEGRELQEQYDAYSDRESDSYLESISNKNDPDYESGREFARDKLKADNPEWVDNMRRIEALDHGATDDVVESWVERGKEVDLFGASSAKVSVWLLDNLEIYRWALDEGLLTDDGGLPDHDPRVVDGRNSEKWNIPVIRINAKWWEMDEKYDYESEGVRKLMLLNPENEEYRKDRRRRDAWRLGLQQPMIDAYVDWFEVPAKEQSDHALFYNIHPKETYYEDDWWLMENKGFERAMVDLYEETHGQHGWKEMRDYSKVPTREVFELYKKWKDIEIGPERRAFEAANPTLDEWLHLTTGSMLETEREVKAEPSTKIEKLLAKYDSAKVGDERLKLRCENSSLDDWLVKENGYTPAYGTDRCAGIGDGAGDGADAGVDAGTVKKKSLSWVEQLEEQGLLEDYLKKFG